MKHRIRELATTIPGIFFILVACTFYLLDLLEKVEFTFMHMLPPLFLGLFLILFKIDDIKMVVSKVIGKITIFMLIVVAASSCTLESRMLRSDNACLICDDICDIRDSVYIEKNTELIKYDTIIRFIFDDNWLTAAASVTDTVYISNTTSESFAYVDSGVLRIALRNNKELERKITLYRERITEKTERFEKSQALNNKMQADLTNTRQSLDKKTKQRNTLFIIALILLALCTLAIRKKLKLFL